MYVWERQAPGQMAAMGGAADSASLVDQIQEALVKKQWRQALSLLVSSGERDEKNLTNRIFFARHPERQGRKLTKGEARFTQLSREWLQIRDDLVRPHLAARGTTTPTTSTSPPRPTSSSKAIGSAPRLIDREAPPHDYTLYVDIPLGINWAKNKQGKTFKVQQMTGIFVPKDYRPQLELDLILYLHGHKGKYPGDSAAIDQYWDSQRFPFFGLRERLDESGKNVILAAPTLGPLSQAGNLTKAGGFDSYIAQLVAALAAHGPYQHSGQVPNVRNIILACHSGGGSPMLRIVKNQDAYAAKIQECWGFDCLYSGYADKEKTKKLFTQPQHWLEWAKAAQPKKLLIYYKSSTAAESQYLDRVAKAKKLTNVKVVKSKAEDHFWVPFYHWVERIKSTPFLMDK